MPPSRDPAYDTGRSTERDAAKCKAYEHDGQRQDSVSTSRQQDFFSTERSNDVAANELEVETVIIYVIIQNIIVIIIRHKTPTYLQRIFGE